ncbi:MAG TPA: hypothetical protein VFE60_21815 [Roseiarcus sp.]|jgi:hypothetical protein|nr:hypothetical protein [Roseiarcus sp.]
MNEESFSKISAGIQSIVSTIGIVVAGVWVLYTFSELGSTQKSRAEIAALERQTFQEPASLALEIKPDVSFDSNNGRRQVRVDVVFRNDGKKVLQFEKPILKIVKVLENSEAVDTAVHEITLIP